MADETAPLPTEKTGRDQFCAECGAPPFMGFGNDPGKRYCHEHMPGLTEDERARYRTLLGAGGRAR